MFQLQQNQYCFTFCFRVAHFWPPRIVCETHQKISHLQFSHGQNNTIEIFSKIFYFHAKIAKIASVDFTDKIRKIEQKNLANFCFFFSNFHRFQKFLAATFLQEFFCRNSTIFKINSALSIKPSKIRTSRF